MLTQIGQSQSIRDLRRLPRPEQRKPRLTNLVKKITCTGRLHEHLKELLFEILIRSREGLE